jgi:hypothetical protein
MAPESFSSVPPLVTPLPSHPLQSAIQTPHVDATPTTTSASPTLQGDTRVPAAGPAAQPAPLTPLGEFDRLFHLDAEPTDAAAKDQWLHKGWQTVRDGTTFQHELPRECSSETEARLWKMKRTLEKADPNGRVRDAVVKENLVKPMGYLLEGALFGTAPSDPAEKKTWIMEAKALEVQAGGARNLIAQVKEAFPHYDYHAVDAANDAFKVFEGNVKQADQ